MLRFVKHMFSFWDISWTLGHAVVLTNLTGIGKGYRAVTTPTFLWARPSCLRPARVRIIEREYLGDRQGMNVMISRAEQKVIIIKSPIVDFNLKKT